MMKFGDFLSAENIRLAHNEVKSRKKILEILSEMLSSGPTEVDAHTVFSHLIEREKLGSTALGESVAIPHCRIAELDKPHVAVLRVAPAIPYDAPDNQPVSLFLGLLVPEQATDEHLNILSNLAETLARPEIKDILLNTEKIEDMLSILKE